MGAFKVLLLAAHDSFELLHKVNLMGLIMELESLKMLLDKIQGCTFATLDTTTKPTPGVRKVTTGTRVILFTNRRTSGYEEMVKRRLIEAGKNPSDFVLGDLPWGERIPNSPLIVSRGNYYLQTIILEPGQSTYYTGDREIDPTGLLPSRRTNQGLSKEDEVHVATYRIDHIDSLALMGEVLIANREGLVPLGG